MSLKSITFLGMTCILFFCSTHAQERETLMIDDLDGAFVWSLGFKSMSMPLCDNSTTTCAPFSLT